MKMIKMIIQKLKEMVTWWYITLNYFDKLAQKIKTIPKGIGRRIGWYILRTEEWKWDHRLFKILKTVPEEKHRLYSAILTNQHNHEVEDAGKINSSTSYSLDTVRLAKLILDNLTILDLVGVQPMRCPVESMFKLRFVKKERENGVEQLTIEVLSQPIEAATRKCQAKLATTAQEDLKKFHPAIDAEKEILTILAVEIAGELDAEVLGILAKSGTINDEPHVIENNQMLPLLINKYANTIASDTRRGAGNWVVLSPKMLSRVEMGAGDAYKSTGQLDFTSGPIAPVGKLNNQITVYVNVNQDDDHVLVGYKGHGEIDCGLVYGPYFMVLSTGMLVDKDTYEPQIGFMTRRGILVDEDTSKYYQNIKVQIKEEE